MEKQGSHIGIDKSIQKTKTFEINNRSINNNKFNMLKKNNTKTSKNKSNTNNKNKENSILQDKQEDYFLLNRIKTKEDNDRIQYIHKKFIEENKILEKEVLSRKHTIKILNKTNTFANEDYFEAPDDLSKLDEISPEILGKKNMKGAENDIHNFLNEFMSNVSLDISNNQQTQSAKKLSIKADEKRLSKQFSKINIDEKMVNFKHNNLNGSNKKQKNNSYISRELSLAKEKNKTNEKITNFYKKSITKNSLNTALGHLEELLVKVKKKKSSKKYFSPLKEIGDENSYENESSSSQTLNNSNKRFFIGLNKIEKSNPNNLKNNYNPSLKHQQTFRNNFKEFLDEGKLNTFSDNNYNQRKSDFDQENKFLETFQKNIFRTKINKKIPPIIPMENFKSPNSLLFNKAKNNKESKDNKSNTISKNSLSNINSKISHHQDKQNKLEPESLDQEILDIHLNIQRNKLRKNRVFINPNNLGFRFLENNKPSQTKLSHISTIKAVNSIKTVDVIKKVSNRENAYNINNMNKKSEIKQLVNQESIKAAEANLVSDRINSNGNLLGEYRDNRFSKNLNDNLLGSIRENKDFINIDLNIDDINKNNKIDKDNIDFQNEINYYNDRQKQNDMLPNSIKKEIGSNSNKKFKHNQRSDPKIGHDLGDNKKEFSERKNRVDKNLNIEDDERSIKNFSNIYDSFSEDEIDDSILKKPFYILTPNGRIKEFIDGICSMLILYSIIVSPYQMAFDHDTILNKNFLFYIDLFIDGFFIIDLLLNFFTAYKNERDDMIYKLSKIFMNYINGWFLMDLVSSIPFTLINFIVDSQENSEVINYSQYTFFDSSITSSYGNFSSSQKVSEKFDNISKLKNFAKIARLYRVLKWAKIFRFFKITKKGTNINPLNMLEDLSESWSRFLQFLMIFIVFAHISACLWCFIAKSLMENGDPFNWIHYSYMDDSSDGEIYIAGFYFTLVTIFSVGYGDITGKCFYERLFIVILMSIGCFLYSFFLTSLSNILGKLDKKTEIFNYKENILNDIRLQYKISDNLYHKIKKSLMYDIMHWNFDKFSLLDTLPSILRIQIYMKMYGKKIANINFFSNKSYEFITATVSNLRSAKFFKDDYIISFGELVDEMYMTTHGVIGLQLAHNYEKYEICEIPKGYHFGDILMYTNEQSKLSYKVKSVFSQHFVLTKVKFAELKLNFKVETNKILEYSYAFFTRVEKIRSLAIDYYENKGNFKNFRLYIKKLINKHEEKSGSEYSSDIDLSEELINDEILLDEDIKLKDQKYMDQFIKEGHETIIKKPSLNTIYEFTSPKRNAIFKHSHSQVKNVLPKKVINNFINFESQSPNLKKKIFKTQIRPSIKNLICLKYNQNHHQHNQNEHIIDSHSNNTNQSNMKSENITMDKNKDDISDNLNYNPRKNASSITYSVSDIYTIISDDEESFDSVKLKSRLSLKILNNSKSREKNNDENIVNLKEERNEITKVLPNLIIKDYLKNDSLSEINISKFDLPLKPNLKEDQKQKHKVENSINKDHWKKSNFSSKNHMLVEASLKKKYFNDDLIISNTISKINLSKNLIIANNLKLYSRKEFREDFLGLSYYYKLKEIDSDLIKNENLSTEVSIINNDYRLEKETILKLKYYNDKKYLKKRKINISSNSKIQKQNKGSKTSKTKNRQIKNFNTVTSIDNISNIQNFNFNQKNNKIIYVKNLNINCSSSDKKKLITIKNSKKGNKGIKSSAISNEANEINLNNSKESSSNVASVSTQKSHNSELNSVNFEILKNKKYSRINKKIDTKKDPRDKIESSDIKFKSNVRIPSLQRKNYEEKSTIEKLQTNNFIRSIDKQDHKTHSPDQANIINAFAKLTPKNDFQKKTNLTEFDKNANSIIHHIRNKARKSHTLLNGYNLLLTPKIDSSKIRNSALVVNKVFKPISGIDKIKRNSGTGIFGNNNENNKNSNNESFNYNLKETSQRYLNHVFQAKITPQLFDNLVESRFKKQVFSKGNRKSDSQESQKEITSDNKKINSTRNIKNLSSSPSRKISSSKLMPINSLIKKSQAKSLLINKNKIMKKKLNFLHPPIKEDAFKTTNKKNKKEFVKDLSNKISYDAFLYSNKGVLEMCIQDFLGEIGGESRFKQLFKRLNKIEKSFKEILSLKKNKKSNREENNFSLINKSSINTSVWKSKLMPK